MSGVLWTGLDTIVPGAQEAVKFLREKVCHGLILILHTMYIMPSSYIVHVLGSCAIMYAGKESMFCLKQQQQVTQTVPRKIQTAFI